MWRRASGDAVAGRVREALGQVKVSEDADQFVVGAVFGDGGGESLFQLRHRDVASGVGRRNRGRKKKQKKDMHSTES